MYILRSKDAALSSYIGGWPKVPSGVGWPLSASGVPMSFFFTVEFPVGHVLHGYTISLFASTDEFHEEYSIPEMVDGALKGVAIPDGFLKSYQKYFSVFLFRNESAVVLSSFEKRVERIGLEFSDSACGDVFGWAGRGPKWIAEDEHPGIYEGKLFEFALQVKGGQEFPIIPSAPAQQEMDIFGGGKQRRSRSYTLFNQNEVYFFCCDSDVVDDRVYVITQC